MPEHHHAAETDPKPTKTLEVHQLESEESSNGGDIKAKFLAWFNAFDAKTRHTIVAFAVTLTVLVVLAVGWGLTQGSPAPEAEASPSPSPSTTATPSPSPSTSPSPSPSSSVKPSTTPKTTPKPTTTTQATPTPTTTSENKTYVLNRSVADVTTNVNSNYAVYALLKYDGQTVTNQSNIRYEWTSNAGDVVQLTPFRACIEGVQEPCPEGHVTIRGLKEGNAVMTAKAFWNTGALIDDVTINVRVNAAAATPTPAQQPPVMSISYPSNGQNIVFESSDQTLCVVDVPVSGTGPGLQRRHNINNSGWSSYVPHYTYCQNPPNGSNNFQFQYKNAAGLESPVYTINFTFTRP